MLNNAENKNILNNRLTFYAKSDVTCYLLHGNDGDLLIDTGLPQTFRGMQKWLKNKIFDMCFLHMHMLITIGMLLNCSGQA